MKLCLLLLLYVTTGFTQPTEEPIKYDGYRLYQVTPKDQKELEILKHLKDNEEDDYKFWNGLLEGRTIDVLVPPSKIAKFEEQTVKGGMNFSLVMDDVQKFIDEENPLASSRKSFGWDAYYRLDQIYSWLDSLTLKYPTNLKSLVGGKSYEGRQIRGVKLSYKEGNPGIFIEGGIHAREWISPAVVTYVLNELLTSNDTRVRQLATSYDWYIFPSFNPDGYEYTHTINRLWRKTRKPTSWRCSGADPNRNWGFHFAQGGTSNNPCSETYPGTQAFSEIETKSMSEYIATVHDKLFAYIAFHSYSQLLLLPYGHSNARVSNYDDLMTIGTASANALAKRYNTKYKVGNIVDVIYVASGGSMDYVRGTYNIPITYTYELRDTGRNGFILPASQIKPTGEETLDSLVAMFEKARELGYGKSK